MKTTILIILLITFAKAIHAQDIITRSDSSKVTATVLEVNPTSVKYKLFNYNDGPTITINKEDVSYITFKNGATERYQKPNTGPKNFGNYDPNRYNLDAVPVTIYNPIEKAKKCEKLYNKKNYLGFNYIAFLNTALGFNYMRDIKKANLIINVPFAFGLGSPAITNNLYGRGFLDGTSTSKYEIMKYQVGINALFAPSMNRDVNFLMGPSFTFSEFEMSVHTKYTTKDAPQNQYNNATFSNNFNLRREHYGVNIGFLARFSERINMNMLITFGYKKDSYSEKDPFGIGFMQQYAKYQAGQEENVMPYVNFAWSIGYRF